MAISDRRVSGREPGVRLADLFADLLWPKLLRAPALALRPERVFVGLLMVVLIDLIARVPIAWNGDAWVGAMSTQPGFPVGGWTAWADFAGQTWAWAWSVSSEYPFSFALVKLLSLVVVAFGGCMICRMAACDFSQSVIVGVAEARNFTAKRFGSLLFAVLGPVVLALVIALGMAVVGWVLFGVPYVNVLGAILYFLFLIGGAVIVVILLAYMLGYPLLIPAVACEGSDGIDAIGRVYPYVLSRPLRLILYYLLAGAILWIVVGIAFWIAGAVNGTTARAASWFLGDRGTAIFGLAVPADAEVAGGGRAAYEVVQFWSGLVLMLASAYAVSVFFCASTIVYLLMRKVCDGQDVAELWMPGMVEGTMAESMRGRAEVAGTAVNATAGGAGGAPPGEADSE